jgi:hypothetical protein
MAATAPSRAPALPVAGQLLPERANVHWRTVADARAIRRSGRLWTAITFAHTVPFIAASAFLIALQPLAAPVALVALAHAWLIPELYARRGANVVNPKASAVSGAAHTRALGLLGDLLDHDARDLYAASGLAIEPGGLGTWLLGEAGALLVAPGGRRVYCYCVRVTDAALPGPDLTAHLLLALRTDEEGFATVANLTFSGARWRIAHRLDRPMRVALDEAARPTSTH